MIDVFFSEGAAYTWYLSTIPVEERTDEPIQEFESIIYLPFLFDLGDFSDGISYTSRENLFCEIHRSKFSSEAELRSRFRSLTKQWQRLEKEAQRGATFRIWVGPSANDGCGLYFLCSILKDIEVSLSVVHRPPYQLTPFKSLVFFAKMDTAAVIMGTKVPVVMTSRTDTVANKMLSIMFSIYLSEKSADSHS